MGMGQLIDDLKVHNTDKNIKYLSSEGKSDITVSAQFGSIAIAYQTDKLMFKQCKQDVKRTKENIIACKSYISMLHPIRSFKAIRELHNLRKQLKREEIALKQARRDYKNNLKTFRKMRNEIRQQAKNVRQTKEFVNQVKQAQALGVNLPNNIIVECQRVQAVYPNQKYSLAQPGNTKLIDSVNQRALGDVKKIVAEKKMRIGIEKARGIAKDTVNLLKDGVENAIESANNTSKKGQTAYER